VLITIPAVLLICDCGNDIPPGFASRRSVRIVRKSSRFAIRHAAPCPPSGASASLRNVADLPGQMP
jgi:hypothetical protein